VCLYRFLHDRGDYKSGWQMEKEWDAEQSRKKKHLEDSIAHFQRSDYIFCIRTTCFDYVYVVLCVGEEGGTAQADEAEEDFTVDIDDTLPFACFICRSDFNNPVVTLCGHYFCQACILLQTKEDSRCPVCQKQTSGVFNAAHKLNKQLALKTNTGVSVETAPRVAAVSRGAWESVE
jgi:RING finger protein 113A